MKPFFLKMAAPIPKILNMRKALFVGPHPDDIEIGAGSTISLLRRNGVEVVFVIITDGGAGSFNASVNIDELIMIRHEEAINSARVLDVNQVHCLNFPDGGKYNEWDIAIKLAELIVQISPDIIFSPDPDLPSEVHPDHLKTGRAVKSAMLISSSPLTLKRNLIFLDHELNLNFNRTLAFYYTHRPNQYISVTKTDVEKSFESILRHQSQFQANSNEWKSLKSYLTYRKRRYGTLFKPRRDAFFVIGPIHQHCFPEINEY